VGAIADRKRRNWRAGDSLHADLSHVSFLGHAGLFFGDLHGVGVDTSLHWFARSRIVHGDGTTTAAKKGGDNIGFSGHKKMKGDKVVAFCDRNCNVIAPFVSAPGNRT
jgi:hypothetical protein